MGLAAGRVYFLTLLEPLAGRPDSGSYRQVGQQSATAGAVRLRDRLINRSCRVEVSPGTTGTEWRSFGPMAWASTSFGFTGITLAGLPGPQQRQPDEDPCSSRTGCAPCLTRSEIDVTGPAAYIPKLTNYR